MTTPEELAAEHDTPTLDDVITPTEQATPDHHEHGKSSPRPNDEYLQERAEHEREEIAGDQG